MDLPARLAGQPALGMIVVGMSRRVSPLCDEPGSRGGTFSTRRIPCTTQPITGEDQVERHRGRKQTEPVESVTVNQWGEGD